jgi:hypothetical protein
MRLLCGFLLVVICAPGAEPVSKGREYRRGLVNKRSLAGAGASAAINTARNSPVEWGQSAAGVVKRFGSSLGHHAVKHSIQFGVNAWRHENLRYRRSSKHGTWPRMGYALKHTFIVPRTNRGGKTLAVSRISGNMGAGVVSRLWQPASAASLSSGLATGGIGLGADVGLNMAREFWPRKKNRVRPSGHRAPSQGGRRIAR